MSSATIELTPARWQRINVVFAAALEREAAERDVYLKEICEDDPELLTYIRSLLQSGESVDATVQDAIARAMNATIAGDNQGGHDDMRGARIGSYEVDCLLGEGGMGAVYLAHRADDQFEQQVAIKLGRRKLIDPMTQARLKAERQILANLDHPNIARLLDGGTTEDGVPYIVMEHIDGVRIDTYCDVNRLTLDERLSLFQTICDAVHYAHQNLVIHRDIKASNILVTSDGVAKLLDFGIAKLIDDEGVASHGLTREGTTLMTPENAAPEQVRGRPVTTATDTYSLGLLLYRLLTGVAALELDGLSPAQFARAVCDEMPTRPSRRLALADADPDAPVTHRTVAAIAADRRRSIDGLQRSLRGDLDTIVLKALRKEPERRYASSLQLAEDIDLYLRSMPIRAREDSWRYRCGKFIRRHRLGVGVSLAAVVVLCGFIATLYVQNERIRAERDHAQAINLFLEDIFTAPDPANARGLDITAKEILAAGTERIAADLEQRPEVQASLMETIGRVYFNLGEYTPSIEMLEQSLSIRVGATGEEGAAVAGARNALAEALIRTADYERAEELLQAALAANRREFGDRSLPVAKNRFNLAELNLATGMLDEAEGHARASIVIYEPAGHEHRVDLAEAKNVLARILQVRGDLEQTEALLREAIAILDEAEGGNHPLMAYYLQSLGVLLQSRGDLDGAEQTFAAAIDATRSILGENHDLVATTLAMLGSLQHARGNLGAAENAYREALQLDIVARGERHPFVGYDLTSLAALLHDTGDLAGAERELRRALDIYAETLDSEHQYVASALTELGAVLTSAGRADEAVEILDRALAIRRKDYDDTDRLPASTAVEYGLALYESGEHGKGRSMIETYAVLLSDGVDRRAKRARAALEHVAAVRSSESES